MDLADAFEPFMAISAQGSTTTHGITVLEGVDRIDAALDRATAECRSELLTVQPGGGRHPDILHQALKRVEPLLSRGVRMRSLYQHTMRYSPATLAYLERVGQQVEVRTLEELIERLIVVDRIVAIIPARRDRKVALEIRHPSLVEYLASVFDQFWRFAAPLGEDIPYSPTTDGITGVQRSIARLLVEGHVDETIARRLGMNVRTCRGHIARLNAALGSNSRAQLGYLIAQSGILESETSSDNATPDLDITSSEIPDHDA
ncbi:hypothetical protein GCM10020367_33960 [Streptomyces sannanensis]|uniref:HTH luxR-type domain-containing protein n=1 Tax=Streptomyces sannanensis TaxID=285536 RepID=A0ABP6SCW6_9ACTN